MVACHHACSSIIMELIIGKGSDIGLSQSTDLANSQHPLRSAQFQALFQHSGCRLTC